MEKSDRQIAQEFDRYRVDAEHHRKVNEQFALIAETARRRDTIYFKTELDLAFEELARLSCVNS